MRYSCGRRGLPTLQGGSLSDCNHPPSLNWRKATTMRTQLTIWHADAEALKTSPLWTEIMKVFLVDGSVFVEEISAVDQDDAAADAA